MAYPNRYYDMQRAVMRDIGFAVRTGLCPVCRIRPRARWPDTNALRVTCGAHTCFIKWLPVHTPQEEEHP
jgi:hypothetical protein